MDIDKNAVELALRKQKLDEECRTATMRMVYEAEPMDEGEFWEVLAPFAKELKVRGVKSCCHNLMYYNVYSKGDKAEAWKRMCGFLKRYELFVHELSDKCWDMPGLERGDDGFGDLMDSLPLAGRDVCQGILEGDIANYRQLEKAVKGLLKGFILDGENYIAMGISSAVKRAFLIVARELGKCEDEPLLLKFPPH
jgi:hypothetical protein